jgi:4-hydroxy-tetrahydrodipicolinate reductase
MVWVARRHREPEAAAVTGRQEARSTERRRLRTAHYGLGEVGRRVVALLIRRADVQIVGALDADPLNVGRDLGDVVGLGYGLGVTVSCEPEILVSGVDADVVIHATSPYLSVASPQLLPLLGSGKSVISACDELVYAWTSHLEMASRLDATAKEAPSALWAAAGVGMTVDAFRQAASEGLVGLPALLDSVALMAASLSWRLDKVTETIEPIQATRRWETEAAIVAKGRIAGLRQLARGYRSGAEMLSLDLCAFLGAPDPHDTIVIRGRPPISARIEGGIPSHLATAALMVHALPALATAPPGLLSGAELLGTYSRQ